MKLSVITCFSVLFALLSGCQLMQTKETVKPYIAEYSAEKIKVDGKLDEKIWEKAENLSFQALDNSVCTENGTAKIIWDDKYIYVGAKLNDSDIVQESNENQVHHYKTGDLLELFLKPNAELNYWEIYATPNNKKTSFFFHSQGRLGISGCFDKLMPGLLVASTCDGTLNNFKDRDKCWTIEMAIPRAELEKHGGKIIPGKAWLFLVSRYNYSAYFNHRPELSLTGKPAGGGGYHNFNSWRSIIFSGTENKKTK